MKPQTQRRIGQWAILIFIIIFSGCAFAEGKPTYINRKAVIIDVVNILNPMTTRADEKLLPKALVALLKDNQVKARAEKRRSVDDPFETFSTGRMYPEDFEDAGEAEYSYWLNRFRRVKPYHILIVTSPPWWHGGVGTWRDGAKPQRVGYAPQSWIKRGCVVNITANSYDAGGVPAFLKTLLSAFHESLHCLGAQHYNEVANAMHEDAGKAGSFNVLPQTLAEIGAVLR